MSKPVELKIIKILKKRFNTDVLKRYHDFYRNSWFLIKKITSDKYKIINTVIDINKVILKNINIPPNIKKIRWRVRRNDYLKSNKPIFWIRLDSAKKKQNPDGLSNTSKIIKKLYFASESYEFSHPIYTCHEYNSQKSYFRKKSSFREWYKSKKS